MWDVWDVVHVECLGCEILRMWNVGMLGMWDVWDVRCLGCRMFGILGTWDVFRCGMLGMWNVSMWDVRDAE